LAAKYTIRIKIVPIVLDSMKKFSALRLLPCPPIQWPSAQPRVMALATPMKVMMALTGVRRTGWTRPIQRGSRPSRPALKISRHWEFTAAMSTPRVEVSPAR
jgi:hypothetical protein